MRTIRTTHLNLGKRENFFVFVCGILVCGIHEKKTFRNRGDHENVLPGCDAGLAYRRGWRRMSMYVDDRIVTTPSRTRAPNLTSAQRDEIGVDYRYRHAHSSEFPLVPSPTRPSVGTTCFDLFFKRRVRRDVALVRYRICGICPRQAAELPGVNGRGDCLVACEIGTRWELRVEEAIDWRRAVHY